VLLLTGRRWATASAPAAAGDRHRDLHGGVAAAALAPSILALDVARAARVWAARS
jgi:hypothetical protein